MKQLILALTMIGTPIMTVTAQDRVAVNVKKTHHDKLGMTVISAEFNSPSSTWIVDDSQESSELKWIQLDYEPVATSVRYRTMQMEKQGKRANSALWPMVHDVRRYAQANGGIGPAKIDDLDWIDQVRFYHSPWDASTTSPAYKAAEQARGLRSQVENTTRQIEYYKRNIKSNREKLKAVAAKIDSLKGKELTDIEKKQLTSQKTVHSRLTKTLKMQTRQLAANEKRLTEHTAAQAELLAKQATNNTQPKTTDQTLYFFLIPNVDINGSNKPMILELRPYMDDGKHYVGYSSGRVQRVDIDNALLKAYNLSIQPLNSAPKTKAPAVPYTLYAQLIDRKATTTTVNLVNRKDLKQTRKLAIDLSKASIATDLTDVSTWASLRANEWVSHAIISPDSPCNYWISQMGELYGKDSVDGLDDLFRQADRRNRRRGRSTTAFSVLGGRAAIQETLQTQVIGVNKSKQGERNIPLSSIEGVTVKSHEYKTMLAGQTGGQLKIAELVPADRLMIYFRRPVDLADFLEDGNSFMFESGATASATSFNHGLKDRYSEILGVGSGWGKIFLRSNLINEIIAFSPDTFFVEGTDLTVIMNVKQMDLLTPLLSTIGVNGLGDGRVVQKPGKDGQTSFWYADETHLMISSNLREMAQAQKLLNSNGAGSLGASDEFRYMLTKLPITEATWGFAYLSDPFIRRLVGPEVKIGQYRRVTAQAEMEALAAAALLYKTDGHTDTPTVDTLVTMGYATPALGAADYDLHDDLSVSSKIYGRPSQLRSIQSLKIRDVTEEERKAYATYMDNYNSFWRQFFDPIAVRLNENTGGELEAEVFILPLIDSSIYQMVRQVIGRPGIGPKMRVPTLTPAPVAMVSAKLQETVWVDALGNFGTKAFEGFGIQNFPFDELGPSVHFAIMDGDPVVALGSGDILGAFNSNTRMFGRNSEMLLIPAAMTLFTRPCKLMVELRDAEKVTQSLRAALAATIQVDNDFSVSFSQIKGKDSWMVIFDIAGLVKMRFGLKVQNDYLVISNLPWKDVEVGNVAIADTLDSAAIHVQPTAGVEQLPGLFAAANSSKRKAAFRSAAHLWPMMAAGAKDLSQAVQWHQTIYGFTPTHPGTGTFEWKDQMVSSDTYGSMHHQLEPEYTKGNTDFGLFGKIKILTLSMQFEDDGLRTRVRWKVTK